MKVNPVVQKLIAVCVIVMVVMLAACSQPDDPGPSMTDAPSDEVLVSAGQVLLEERCTVCHDLARTTSKTKTTEEWTQTVESMVQKGAELTAEEQAVLIDYLGQTYGPATQ